MEKQLTEDQLIELVRKIKNCEGTEEEIDEWQLLLQRNVPDPEMSDLIFYSDENLSPEEIVERAMSYRPIPLPPSEADGHQLHDES